MPFTKSIEFTVPDEKIPGKTIVFIGFPLKYADCLKEKTRLFIRRLLETNQDPDASEYYVISDVLGVNTVWATCQLAEEFDRYLPAEWFLLWSDDLVSTPEDLHALLMAAQTRRADVISGVCVVKMVDSDRANRRRWILCGDFVPGDERGTVRMPHRNIGITDLEVQTGEIKAFDFVGGGCAFFHRRVIEALRPEANGGLGYFCHDKQNPAYDLRVFQRVKEKGFQTLQHSGVLFGHVGTLTHHGKDGQTTKVEYPFTYWDLPSYRQMDEQIEKEEDVVCLTI